MGLCTPKGDKRGTERRRESDACNAPRNFFSKNVRAHPERGLASGCTAHPGIPSRSGSCATVRASERGRYRSIDRGGVVMRAPHTHAVGRDGKHINAERRAHLWRVGQERLRTRVSVRMGHFGIIL